LVTATRDTIEELLTDAAPRSEQELLARLESAFRQRFAVVDPARGVLEQVTTDWPRVDVFRWLPLCEQVARSGRVELLEEHAPLMLIAVPIPQSELAAARVAVAVLLTEAAPAPEALASAARVFGVDHQHIDHWSASRKAWPPYAAIALAEAVTDSSVASSAAVAAKSHLSEVSSQLLATFEELHLLHQLTEGLSLGRSEAELVEQAVGWLADIVPADCVIARFGDDHDPPYLAGGECPVPGEDLDDFFDRLGPQAQRRAMVLNRDRTASPTWAYPSVRELVTAPVLSNGRQVGWFAALNYRSKRGYREGTFGSVEASLLSSVATLVGVHAGNRTLYDERAALFDGAVHALTSAIDAKDPYTCGHSDRVARISVRLAQQLGCDDDQINTIYLGGLLHDIGKIGVADSVLGKTGQLTDEEFEQIKQHPSLGERILRDVPELSHVLPIILHHHEAWDGGGYPGGLVREETPLLARITAVADGFDAMGSDRPYRKGMPIERVDDILREGAGTQWDPAVVNAYFAAREDIIAISRVEREPLDLDVARWAVGDACPLPT